MKISSKIKFNVKYFWNSLFLIVGYYLVHFSKISLKPMNANFYWFKGASVIFWWNTILLALPIQPYLASVRPSVDSEISTFKSRIVAYGL